MANATLYYIYKKLNTCVLLMGIHVRVILDSYIIKCSMSEQIIESLSYVTQI